MAVPRVISVLPSATEMLCFIGGRHLLVGRSHEDNFPAEVASVPVVTGQKTSFTTSRGVNAEVSATLAGGESLYTIDEGLVRRLRPDVILTQDICSVCAIDLVTVERIAASLEPRPTVVSLNPLSLGDVIDNLLDIGAAVGLAEQASKAAECLRARVNAARAVASAALARRGGGRPSVAFIEWTDPVYVGGHWTPQLIRLAGADHPLNPAPTDDTGASKSFPVEHSALVEAKAEVLLVAPCGLSLEACRRELRSCLASKAWWRTLPAVKAGRVALIDGDAMFNRPGPRLVDALEWLVRYLHQEPALEDNFPWEPLGSLPASIPETASRQALAEDIEEAHEAAVCAGQLSYADPVTGYTVFTKLASFQRGYCCGSGCRHCPYGHFNVADPQRRRNVVTEHVLLRTTNGRRGVDSGAEDSEVHLVALDGGDVPGNLPSGALGVVFVRPSPHADSMTWRRGMVQARELGMDALVVVLPTGEGTAAAPALTACVALREAVDKWLGGQRVRLHLSKGVCPHLALGTDGNWTTSALRDQGLRIDIAVDEV